MSALTACPRCGDVEWNDAAERERGIHDGCNPTVEISLISGLGVVGATVTSTYRDGSIFELQFSPLSSNAMAMGARRNGGRWTSTTTVTNPERFGPIPIEGERGAAKAMLAWANAFADEAGR